MSLKAGFGACAAVIVACGARAGLDPCVTDADCRQVDLCATYACTYDVAIHNKACKIVLTKNCDDNDPCTSDACDKHSGSCVNTWLTFDLDGDLHRGPLPGFAPGAPGSCGDDCDDTDPRAFPGNPEVCDGVDNDCDGIIDNGATYIASPGTELQLSASGFDWAEPNSFTRGTKGQELLATYGGSMGGQFSPWVQPLDKAGQPSVMPYVLTGTVAAGSDMSVAWTGDRFGIAWSDRRNGSFEIYFALLDPSGKKMAPGDERITVSNGFSLYPSLVWTGHEFAMVWQEQKVDGTFMIQGQRIDLDGHLIGNIAALTQGSTDDQGPSLASGITELALVWVRGATSIVYQSFGFDFGGLSYSPHPVTLTNPTIKQGAAASIRYDHKNDRYAVAFYDTSPVKRKVYGTIMAKDGTVVTPLTEIAQSPAQARDPSMFAFGDRILFVYADDRDQNAGYELYTREMSADLTKELEPPTRVTNAPGDSIEPIQSFAADGTVLVIFRVVRGPNPAVFETGL
jgi:hypothetical protein